MLMPCLRYFGAIGNATPRECLAHRNQAVLNFLSECQEARNASLGRSPENTHQ
jgi:hypothetical protein